MTMPDDATDSDVGAGHNQPPPESLLEDLQTRHADKLARFDELTKAFDDVPDEITNDEACGDAQDLFKQMRTIRSDADVARGQERRPYQSAVDVIDAFFQKPREALFKIQKDLKTRIDKFMDEKKAKAKREKEEKARQEKAERDRKIQEAADAERRKAEAEEAQRAAEQAERQARARKEEEERKATAAREYQRRLSRIQPYLHKRSIREAERQAQAEADEQERNRIAAAAKAKADADAAERKRKADEDAKAAKDRAREARKDEGVAKADRVSAKDAAAHADRDAELSFLGAMRAEGRAGRLERQIVSPAALTRTRGDMGSLGSQARRWTFDVVDRDAIPIEQLRGYLHPDAVDSAIQKFMNDHRADPGGPKLGGVVFERLEEAVIR